MSILPFVVVAVVRFVIYLFNFEGFVWASLDFRIQNLCEAKRSGVRKQAPREEVGSGESAHLQLQLISRHVHLLLYFLFLSHPQL